MCGPSTQQISEAGQAQQFGQTLQSNYNTNFADNASILGNLTNILTPIAQAGPNQLGFSAGEKAALNTNAIDTTGANYNNAARATQGELSGRGTPGGPQSGVDQQINASIASQAAGQASTEENQILQSDYATGRSNFNNAVSGLGGVAAQYNPNATASAANTAGQNAFGEATEVQNEENQEQADIAGGITSLAGAAAGGIGGGIGAVGASPAGASQPGAFAQGFLSSF
jgi:hypothetical protein